MAFFKEIPDEFVKCTRSGYTWDCTDFSPKSNGIPPHNILLYVNGKHENKNWGNEGKHKELYE